MRWLFVIIFLLSLNWPISCQEISPKREIGVSVGLRYSAIHEARFSNQTKRHFHPTYGLHYAREKGLNRSTLELRYSTNANSSVSSNLWYKIAHPQVMTTFQRRVGNYWLGGYFESSNLFLFPQGGHDLFGNNSISYTLANNIGLAINRGMPLVTTSQQQLRLDMGFRAAVLSYLTRPIHGHPYPEEYFQEGTFHPTRAGLGKTIFKSGKLRTLDKFQSLQLVIGLSYIHKNRWQGSINYTFQFQKVGEGRPLSYRSHDLGLKISYLY